MNEVWLVRLDKSVYAAFGTKQHAVRSVERRFNLATKQYEFDHLIAWTLPSGVTIKVQRREVHWRVLP